MICTISGDPMYLIEDTPNQINQAKIDSLRGPSNTGVFFINSTIWPLHTNTPPKNLRQRLDSFPTSITLQRILLPTPSLSTNVFKNVFNHQSLVIKA